MPVDRANSKGNLGEKKNQPSFFTHFADPQIPKENPLTFEGKTILKKNHGEPGKFIMYSWKPPPVSMASSVPMNADGGNPCRR